MKLLRTSVLMTGSLLLLLSCSKKAQNEPREEGPKLGISVKNVVVERQKKETLCRFYIDLSGKSTKAITVRYATADSTATSKEDYEAATGSITFQPGEQEETIDITIKGDSLRRSDQYFYLKLSDSRGATLDDNEGVATIVNNGTYLPTDDKGFSTPASYPGYKLVWSDEFSEKTLDKNSWNYETGTGSNGWGNNELEYYTSRPENVFVSSGNLVIEARKEDYNGSKYTSARITTQGKREFTYGRIDMRAKLPVDHGIWPALWMLGSNIDKVGWPKCGETDIMEVVGQNPSQVVGSLHWQKADGTEGTVNNSYDLSSGDFSNQFHVFSLIWTKDSLKILVDDKAYMKASKEDLSDGTYPFDRPSFFIFNVAVGGNWPGPPDQSTSFPQRMFVDYVRVFQKN